MVDFQESYTEGEYLKKRIYLIQKSIYVSIYNTHQITFCQYVYLILNILNDILINYNTKLT